MGREELKPTTSTRADMSVLEIIASPSRSKKELQKEMKKQNDADLALTGKVIASKARNSNFVFSPASLNSVLTIEAASASSATEERKAVFNETATVAFADGKANGGPKITAINGVWVEQSLPVDHSYKNLLVNVFKATFTQVDFRSKADQVRRELNKWVSDQTNGLIKDLLPPGSVDNKTDKVYGNALYFKGAWEDKFSKSKTKDRDFHLLNGTSVSVPFMSSGHDRQYVQRCGGFKVLVLPFRQGLDINRSFSMYFYLPDKKDGLDNLVKKMTSTPGFVDNHNPTCRVKLGDLAIPKFKISFGFEASRAFEGSLVSKALYHKACVEIDEEGAEAAAATIFAVPRSYTKASVDFVADHPFLFLIRENTTGTVLFAGQIFDP
ncbi:probable non-inhibitory serpin-Z5 [Brassica napus]|uniref:probable non-inhibitory serpin-Z5 n=1 Tax=Brassica napus TaxID=3708 RepID=UPI0006AB0EE1|nr:probable non-inhibitory serpin-Z5 [Brassica napus]